MKFIEEEIKYDFNKNEIEVRGERFSLSEYLVFDSRWQEVYLHDGEYPSPIVHKKKGVGKFRWYWYPERMPVHQNARVVRSPRGNFVTNLNGTMPWGIVLNATEEGEQKVRLHIKESLRRGKPVYEVVKKVANAV